VVLRSKIPWDFSGKKSHSLGMFPGNLLDSKGVFIMTAVPFTQCCSMLAVDAKTLRQWLKHSDLSLHSHPTDARIKCLAFEQVQQLATLHGRSIKEDRVLPLEPASGSALLVQPEQPTEEQSERLGVSAHLGTSSPITMLDASDVARSLSS